MTETTYGPVKPAISIEPNFFEKLSLVVAILILDFLLWPGYFGISLVLCSTALFGLKFLSRFHDTALKSKLFAGSIFVLGILPMVEAINTLTFLIGAGFTFVACFALSNTAQESWAGRLDLFLSSTLLAPFRFPKFCLNLRMSKPDRIGKLSVLNWLVPVLLCSVFVILFAYASPIWQNWLEAIDLIKLLELFFSPRIFFWIFMGWIAWPFLENKVEKLRLFKTLGNTGGKVVSQTETKSLSRADWVPFAQRCLILFNLVFGLQNILDFSILWGGAALPVGMSYAEYAHRGAYPLVVAALLAAVFVVVAMRPAGVGERSNLIRNLVLLWVGQNILLLASSLFRLDIYITAYALTYWRIAAFIWMLLVGAGLVLIVARFVLKRSAGWLVIANLMVLVSTLYATSFVNLPYQITNFNLMHSSMAQGNGSTFDRNYLSKLGSHVLPALEGLEGKLERATPSQLNELRNQRSFLTERYLSDYQRWYGNWRAWTYRGHRLKTFVEHQKKQEQIANSAEREAP